MKKILILTSVLLAFTTILNAQTLNDAGELFNTANEQIKAKTYGEAIKSLNDALNITNKLGEEGKDLGSRIEKTIPKIKEAHAKTLIGNKKVDEGLKYLLEAIDDAEKVNDSKTVNSSKTLVANIYVSKAGAANGQKNWEETIRYANLAIQNNEATQKAYLMNALAYKELENEDLLVESINDAVKYGEAKNDTKTVNDAKLIGTNYFNNKAQELIQKNKFSDALSALDKSIAINNELELPWYLKISCLNKLNRADEAIEAGLAGLQLNSENKEIVNGINLELGRAYEAKADNENACKYYKQAATFDTFKEEANYKITEVLKCN
ncbi:hypothetical protein LJC69_00510 [Bacteroidales bacterium OttesenSCG-928-K22]|nr:hypothetical protein [Bacteroidales bacterium OttesenSCG-928-K22]